MTACPSTASLSLLEYGALRRLLDAYHAGGPLPADLDVLWLTCLVVSEEEREAVGSVLDAFFSFGPDGLVHHEGADAELAKRTARHERLSRNGQLGAQKRWKNGAANGPANGAAKEGAA